MPQSVTGVQLAQGIGVRPAAGFWTDAWQNVSRRPAARCALIWLGIVAFFALFAPILANGHPLWVVDSKTKAGHSPLWESLTALDLLLIVWGVFAPAFIVLLGKQRRGARFWAMVGALVLGIIVVAGSSIIYQRMDRAANEAGRQAQAVALAKGVEAEAPPPPLVRTTAGAVLVGSIMGALALGLGLWVPAGRLRGRVLIAVPAVLLAFTLVLIRWNTPLERYLYIEKEVSGEITATYTLVPFSPFQRFSSADRTDPLVNLSDAIGVPKDSAPAKRSFLAGSDAFGQDVLTQLLHACRLAISIGLVATSISVIIGVTVGACAGYFGGKVDLVLSRIIEIFMAVPVLFLLIVAASVVDPELRTSYILMAIIGCFTWTGAARFTRAEFLKLRNQDFVQAAQGAGVPLSSVLFKHILPNGVAPVLVDTSFAIAAAIGLEATLSYLGLGPVESASWGKLLSSAISSEGEFKWWLAVYPGIAIFLSVLSYNLLGEALRDAIDPRLKKARV